MRLAAVLACLLGSPAVADVVFYPSTSPQQPRRITAHFRAHRSQSFTQPFWIGPAHGTRRSGSRWNTIHGVPTIAPAMRGAVYGYFPNYPTYTPAYHKPLPKRSPTPTMHLCDPYEDEGACLGDLDYSGW